MFIVTVSCDSSRCFSTDKQSSVREGSGGAESPPSPGYTAAGNVTGYSQGHRHGNADRRAKPTANRSGWSNKATKAAAIHVSLLFFFLNSIFVQYYRIL